MKPRQPNEDAESYIRRLEASNAELKKIRKWADRVSRAVTALSVEASLAFQAMAEKAGVRSHPSVTEAVRLFDAIAHPQWTPDEQLYNGVEFPDDWDLEQPPAWSGDADMLLNQPIADVLDYLESRLFKCGKEEREAVAKMMDALERPLRGIIEGMFPERHRPPLDIPDEATRDDLANALNDMSWAALDLAQDISTTNEWLRRDLRAASYRRICGALYEMSRVNVPVQNPHFGVKFIGEEASF